jgi:hypothetical protein
MSTRIILVLAWVVSSAGTIISLAYKSASTFNPINGKCMSGVYENLKAMAVFKVALAVIIMIPLLVITIVNLVLCFIAVKASNRAQSNSHAKYKALVMVCALSGLFIVSWVPYVVFTLMKSRNPEVPQSLDLLAFHCIFLNAFGNPILYTLTNRRFGNYVRALLHNVFCAPCGQTTLPNDQVRENQTSSTNAKSTRELEIEEKEQSGPATRTDGEEAL